MPRSLNRVTLLGHLGADAEVKHTSGGTAVANFSIATERRWKDKQSGEWKSETDWHRIVFWRAENLANYLTRGKAVLVEGRLQTRSYEDRSGDKKYITEVVAENIILVGGGKEGKDGEGSRKTEQASSRNSAPPDDDVPF